MADADARVTVQVLGVAEAIKIVGKFDPELRKVIVKDLKDHVRPLVTAAQNALPQKPLTNWGNWRGGYDLAKAKKGIRTLHRTSAPRDNPRAIPILTLNQKDAGGQIVDMAGRSFPGRGSEGLERGAAMVRKLNTFGQASRTLWPAVESNMHVVNSALEQVIDTASEAISRELA